MLKDGIICIDKPADHTSFDVIARVRGILHIRKIGHAGTLDPMTTGVLPVFIGRATKACDILPVQDKRYTAEMRLGTVTDTQDITGQVLEQHPVTVTREEFARAIRSFQGEQMQLPPMYSAVQVGGRRLYDIAREGGTVERTPRKVHFYSIDILELTDTTARLDVHCSKGSYIRTLCHDIGRKLGCGGVLTSLRRTMAAGFTEQECVTLEQLAELAAQGRVEERFLPIARVFDSLPRLELSSKQARLYLHGVKLDCARLGLPIQPGDIAVYDEAGEFLGVSYTDAGSGELRSRKLFKID